MADFRASEYEARTKAAQRGIRAQRLDALLLHQPESICYLSGFAMASGYFEYHALLVPAESEPVLILRALEGPAADESAPGAERAAYRDSENPMTTVATALNRRSLSTSRVGVDANSWFLTLARFSALREANPHVQFEYEPGIVDQLRLRKSPAEIEYIADAGRMVTAGMEAAMRAIKPGTRERDIAAEITAARIRAGSGAPLLGVITSGSRTSILHGSWSDRIVEPGDVVYLEFSAISHNYWARQLRSVVAGPPTPEQQNAADIIIGSLEAGIAAMLPGAWAADVDRVIRGPILKAGLRASYENRVGYSIGLTFLPSPGELFCEIVPSARFTLEEGMVFHVLVMAAGMGFSETVVVRPMGAEVLTKFPRRLAAIT